MWYLEANKAVIGCIGTTPFIDGVGTQELRPLWPSPSFENLPAHWIIAPTNAGNELLDPSGDGPYPEKVRKNSGACHYHIDYFKSGEPSIGFFVAMPMPVFDRCFSIWQDIITNNTSLKFQIDFDFSGFPSDESLTEEPTFEEWKNESVLGGKHLYGTEVRFSFHPIDGP